MTPLAAILWHETRARLDQVITYGEAPLIGAELLVGEVDEIIWILLELDDDIG